MKSLFLIAFLLSIYQCLYFPYQQQHDHKCPMSPLPIKDQNIIFDLLLESHFEAKQSESKLKSQISQINIDYHLLWVPVTVWDLFVISRVQEAGREQFRFLAYTLYKHTPKTPFFYTEFLQLICSFEETNWIQIITKLLVEIIYSEKKLDNHFDNSEMKRKRLQRELEVIVDFPRTEVRPGFCQGGCDSILLKALDVDLQQRLDNTLIMWRYSDGIQLRNMKLIDYPISGFNAKALSFSYSLLSGFFFDGNVDGSACTFIYATADQADNYLYILKLPLSDKDAWQKWFYTPLTNPYYGSVMRFEEFHPRTRKLDFDYYPFCDIDCNNDHDKKLQSFLKQTILNREEFESYYEDLSEIESLEIYAHHINQIIINYGQILFHQHHSVTQSISREILLENSKGVIFDI